MVQCVLPALLALALLTSSLPALSAPKAQSRDIGIARIDITPDYPVRLSGYAARKTESQEVAQRIWAKALAIGSDRQKPAILITVDNCGVPASIREELVRRLSARKIAADRITICSSHTHSAPWLVGYLPNLVVGPLPAEQTARRQRYTGELIDNLEKVALQALADRAPAMLMRGTGRATFAANRRTQGGPVDHDVPVLFILGKDGKAKGILASYACHCTTLTGEFNQICGDWAGYAQEFLERDFPGCTAMITIGCGGDANPYPRPGFDLAQRHGQAIATAVQQVTLGQLTPVNGKLTCRTKTIQLPFDTLPTRAEWEEKAKDTGYIGQHARINLARLDQNQTLPTSLSYMVQVWTFEKNLAVAFLPGEVVVDYALRLKRECVPDQIWVNAYANDVPCYIPSERVLEEGGYEAGYSMIYYDHPTRFKAGVEDRITEAVKALLPAKMIRATDASATALSNK